MIKRFIALFILLSLTFYAFSLDLEEMNAQLKTATKEYKKTTYLSLGGLALEIAGLATMLLIRGDDGKPTTAGVVIGGLAVAGGGALTISLLGDSATKPVILKRYRYVIDNYNNLSPKDANDIWNGAIGIGTPSSVVVAILGKPQTINRSVGSWGIHEQWVYGSKYIYIEDGKVAAFQD